MKVLIFPTRAEAETCMAAELLRTVSGQPDAVLGLATGGTMDRVYERLVSMALAQKTDFSRVRSFNLDEYWGIDADHPASYAHYMRTRLFAPLHMDAQLTCLPNGKAADPDEEARRYEASIAAAGGIDLQILGIGRNGHIGFNEPTSSLGSRTRIKTLTASTREANRCYFAEDETVPAFALTMGIGTILEARYCMLLATGTGKAQAVAAAVEGPLSAACPASVLQLHPRATILLDPDAASTLQLRDYYELVHPAGSEAIVPLPLASH
ncbi:MAG: glucosamine-6-phosphate deaminase [Geminicoccaceae bacterium]|nr:glucosamine-6-phosphate deaminase [Geminicoccaceae bacterium]